MTITSKPLTIGIAGGTGSGKTTLSHALLERVGAENMVYFPHDNYYRDFDKLPVTETGMRNFDHPDALDTHLLIANIRQLQLGKPAEVPIYDFPHHQRLTETRTIAPQPIILVEGILIFADSELRNLFDVKIFVDTDSDIRFMRRLQYDMAHRGRTVEQVIDQYMQTVRPMHLQFVEPSKQYADIIITEGGYNQVAVDMLADRMRTLLVNR